MIMQGWIVAVMNQFGYIGIALLIAIENVFPPIPSEVILTFGGFMTTATKMEIWGVILAATIGSVLGALILYSVGRWLNPKRLESWLDGKIGKMLHFKKEDVSSAGKWFARHGKTTVFFCRFVPIVRSLISIPAGIAQMNLGVFLLLTTLGTAIWNTALVFAGAFLGESWEVAVVYMKLYTDVFVAICAVLAIALGVWYYRKRIRPRA